MKRRALCLITAACLLLSCGKSERAELLDAPGAYTIVDSELMTPGGFADYAYDGSDPTWGKFYQVYLNSLNAALKAKNLLLGAAMAVEAGHPGADRSGVFGADRKMRGSAEGRSLLVGVFSLASTEQ